MKHIILGLKERLVGERFVPRILVIDDDKDVLDYLKVSLEENDKYEVLHARSGREGLGIARWRNPDMVLLDWKMPGMNGLKVLHHIEKIGTTSDIPVCILTADTSFDTFQIAAYKGAINIIHKPIKMMKIFQIIDPILYPNKSQDDQDV